MSSTEPSLAVYIAEDNEDAFFLTQRAFQRAGLPVSLTWAKEGEDLLARLSRIVEKNTDEKMPGLILLDLNLADLSGWQVLNRIKQEPRLKSIPVIILSTSSLESDRRKAYELGAHSFISKPLSFTVFAETIKKVGKYWVERQSQWKTA